jgi:hypothetical protein
MPCSGGRELKQMFANATTELAAARGVQTDESLPLEHRKKRLRDAEANHKWTSAKLLDHLNTCTACQERQSAIRPAFH